MMIFGHVTWHAGMKLVPHAVEAQSPNHWTTREVPQMPFFKKKSLERRLFFQLIQVMPGILDFL